LSVTGAGSAGERPSVDTSVGPHDHAWRKLDDVTTVGGIPQVPVRHLFVGVVAVIAVGPVPGLMTDLD
jgi:hypothetical protein